jgi:hypothetical protein
VDSSLIKLITQLSVNFLSTSPYFEAYVPASHKNILSSLGVLKGLGEITRQSMPTPAALPPPVPSVPKQPPAVVTSLPQNSDYHPALKDAEVIKALLGLKNPTSSPRKGPAFFKNEPTSY